MDKNKQAIEYMKEHKYEEAAKLFNELIEEDPSNPLGFINFGNLLIQLNEYEKAERFFNKAIELDSKAGAAYYALGNLYFEQKLYKEAQEKFLDAIKLDLEDADVYYMLGLTFQKQEQFILSLPYLLRATELNPEDVEISFQYGLSLARCGQIEEARKVFEQVITKNNKHADAYYNLGVIETYHKNNDRALSYFEQALALQPEHLLAANGKKNIEALMNQ